MISNVPEELKALQNWVCFDITPEGKKIPYTPGSDQTAGSNRPTDWRSFRAACKDVESGKRDHIGFCFAESDGFTFIDLDDMEDEDQKRVFKRIRSYSQTSVSGKGVHIICKGTFKGKGKHPAFPSAGLFKTNRFCLMTADIIGKRNKIKVVDDDDLQSIHTWLGGGKDMDDDFDLTEYSPEIPDQTVIDLGIDQFKTKFDEMCSGRWQQFEEYKGDHSTADHAFLAMLCDLTESNQQVRYLFSISGMWSEARAEKKAGHGLTGYLNRTIRTVRSKQARELARTSKIILAFGEDEIDTPEPVEAVITPVKTKGDNNLIESLPPGLVKDIARYSYKSAYLPLQEASLLSGLQMMSVLCGRGYLTPTKSGLNLWLILVGGTGCGKDEYQSCMKRLITATGKRVNSLRKIFGGEIVSGPGIEAVFQDTFRYVSYIPEFGDTFKTLANPQAPDYVKTLTRGLLNSYNSAGQGGSSEGRRKAQKTEEKVYVERPCLCLAGEATPESLYGSMTTRELATGFLQRFILLDVPESSWSAEENAKNGASPPLELINKLEQLAIAMDTADVSGKYTIIDSSPEATKILKDYRDQKRREIMSLPDGLAKKEVINRAGLKALRVASVLAVSADFYSPRIEAEHALWAINFVEKTDGCVLARFDTGEVGSGQVKQESEILRVARSVKKMDLPTRRGLGMNRKVAKEDTMMPLAVIKKMVVNNAAFSGDRLGAVTAFERCVDAMVRAGVFVKVTEAMAANDYDHMNGVLLCLPGE